MKIIIFGATGLIGFECVRQAIEDEQIEHITAIVRRPFDKTLTSDKLTILTHTDFLDYSSLTKIFEEHQGCIWALGVSQNAVSQNDYIQITHDFTLAAASAMAKVNPNLRLVFVSAIGADPTEQSRFLYGRVKGKTETNLIKDSNLKEIYTVRPAGVLASEIPSTKTWYERVFMPLIHVVKVLKPSWVITSVGLARAMIYLVKNGHHATLFENQDLKDLIDEHQLV